MPPSIPPLQHTLHHHALQARLLRPLSSLLLSPTAVHTTTTPSRPSLHRDASMGSRLRSVGTAELATLPEAGGNSGDFPEQLLSQQHPCPQQHQYLISLQQGARGSNSVLHQTLLQPRQHQAGGLSGLSSEAQQQPHTPGMSGCSGEAQQQPHMGVSGRSSEAQKQHPGLHDTSAHCATTASSLLLNSRDHCVAHSHSHSTALPDKQGSILKTCTSGRVLTTGQLDEELFSGPAFAEGASHHGFNPTIFASRHIDLVDMVERSARESAAPVEPQTAPPGCVGAGLAGDASGGGAAAVRASSARFATVASPPLPPRTPGAGSRLHARRSVDIGDLVHTSARSFSVANAQVADNSALSSSFSVYHAGMNSGGSGAVSFSLVQRRVVQHPLHSEDSGGKLAAADRVLRMASDRWVGGYLKLKARFDRAVFVSCKPARTCLSTPSFIAVLTLTVLHFTCPLPRTPHPTGSSPRRRRSRRSAPPALAQRPPQQAQCSCQL